MKYFAVILLFVALTIVLFTKTIVWVYYQYNIEYIKKELCVNKNKPRMNCNGKCYLAKQIKKAESVPVDLPQHIKELKEAVWFIETIVKDIFKTFGTIKKSYFEKSDKLNSLYEFKIFTPPKL